MNAESLAQIVADHLIDRDDVASAAVVAKPATLETDAVEIEVTTQGGVGYVVNVAPAP